MGRSKGWEVRAGLTVVWALLLGCPSSPPPPTPTGAPGPPPTLAELESQLTAGPCVWVRGRRYSPEQIPRVIRHPGPNCRIAAARELEKRGVEAAASTPALLRALGEAADVDTGDGWLMERTAVLAALAAVAADATAIPALREATRTTMHEVGRAAAERAVALGHDPTEDRERAAAELSAGTHGLEALRELAAYDDPRGDEGIIARLPEAPDGDLWRLARARAGKVESVRVALGEACARPAPSPEPWQRERACRGLR